MDRLGQEVADGIGAFLDAHSRGLIQIPEEAWQLFR